MCCVEYNVKEGKLGYAPGDWIWIEGVPYVNCLRCKCVSERWEHGKEYVGFCHACYLKDHPAVANKAEVTQKESFEVERVEQMLCFIP